MVAGARSTTDRGTIVAVSSAEGVSPRGIVRLSGPRAVEILCAVADINSFLLPRRNYNSLSLDVILGSIRLPARAYLMRAPASYTREDIIELHTTGNPAIQRALIGRLIELGARPAEPGEFTRRAFLNGRIDLAQAEAVEQLIHSRNESEYRAALDTLSGNLSRRVHEARHALADLAASVEVALDFSDQDVEIISLPEILSRLAPISADIRRWLAGAQEGRVAPHALRAVFFGPPNAGKSSLFNALLRKRRAIVSPHPGTTRDTLEATAAVDGLELLLVDTAGIRFTPDEIERDAVSRSHRSVQRADVALCVLDATAPPSDETRQALDSLPRERGMILLNKSDLAPCHPGLRAALPAEVETLPISAATAEGTAELLARLRDRVEAGAVDRSAGSLMVSARQADLLRQALTALERIFSAEEDASLDLVASDIRDALASLSALTGDTVTDDVLSRIFSRFCIGK